MIWVLLSSFVVAQNPPPKKPDPFVSSPGECKKEIAIVKAQPINPSLLSNGKMACSGVLVPTSTALELVAIEKWGMALDRYYRIEVLRLKMERDFYQSKLKDSQTPKPFFQRPSTLWGIGIGSGIILSVSTTWALREVTQ